MMESSQLAEEERKYAAKTLAEQEKELQDAELVLTFYSIIARIDTNDCFFFVFF